MKNDLYLIYGKEYARMAKELLRACDLRAAIPSAHTKIGIKPNLMGQVLPEEGATTHPEVVEGIISYLQEEGFTDIVILESSWVGDRTELAFDLCGYTRLAQQYGVPLWDLQKDGAAERPCAGMTLRVCKKVEEIGFLINVPVLKGHCQTKVSGALKNMKGLLPGSEKRRFHRMGLHEPIAHLSAGVHQDFILADCICPDLTFEDGGDPVSMDCLIGSWDPVLCDACACRMIGLDPETVDYIRLSRELGVGSPDLASARIMRLVKEAGSAGDTYEIRPGSAVDLPAGNGGYASVMRLAENVEDVESCSACYAYLIPALQMLEQDGILEKLREKICIGQGYRGKTGKLGVGSCTALFEHTVGGCPPTEGQMYEFLKDYLERSGEISGK